MYVYTSIGKTLYSLDNIMLNQFHSNPFQFSCRLIPFWRENQTKQATEIGIGIGIGMGTKRSLIKPSHAASIQFRFLDFINEI